MAVAYIDSSAAVKLLVEEPESSALSELAEGLDLFACDLVETELRRYAVRWSLPQAHVTQLVESLTLVELDRAAYREAGLLLFPGLRTLDALHLVAVLRMDAPLLLTYDLRMIEAARSLGLEVLSPGSEPKREQP